MAMEAMVDMDSAMEATAMAVLVTVTARGLRTLRLRLMPTTAMEDMVDTVLVTPPATVLATDTAVTERGPLILRPMPTTDMVDMDSVTVDTAMAVLATAMARGLLMPSLTT